jgi:hypothetical protein
MKHVRFKHFGGNGRDQFEVSAEKDDSTGDIR